MGEKGVMTVDGHTSMRSMLVASLVVSGIVASSGAEASGTVVMHEGLGQFAPQVTTAEVGERITWVNYSRTDDVFVTASQPVTGHVREGMGELEVNTVLHPGSIYSHAFKAPGAYYYYCAGHEGMWGIVVVR
ncbi:MAG: cupredoxin domain-containing protein [Nitrospirota bacterium]